MNKALLEVITKILSLAVPYVLELIKSKVVPAVKRKAWEKANDKIDESIADLAQNASKIVEEKDPVKKAAYIEGTKLGIDMLRILSEKCKQAADKIAEVVEC